MKDIYIAAKKLISNPENYCVKYFATDGFKIVDPQNERAVCFCSRGALYRASGENLHMHVDNPLDNPLEKPLHEAARTWLEENHPEDSKQWEMVHVPAAYVNNVYGHGAAMEVYDLAIKSLS